MNEKLFKRDNSSENELLITLKTYLENTFNKVNSTPSSYLKIIRENFKQRYEILIKNHKEFKCDVVEENDSYFILVHVPSETIDDLTYEVLFKINPVEGETNKEKILNYKTNFFSNSPSFIFTYCYAFFINNQFIEDVVDKVNAKAITKEPFVKNHYKIIGYEKSLFFACQYINDNIDTLSKLKKLIKDGIDKKDLLDMIRTDIEKLNEYKDYKQKMKQKEDSNPMRKIHSKLKKEAIKHVTKNISSNSNVKNKRTTKIKAKPKITSKTSKRKIRAKSKIK